MSQVEIGVESLESKIETESRIRCRVEIWSDEM